MTGVLTGGFGKVIPGTSSFLGTVGRGELIGGASMAGGSAVSQYAMTGTIDGSEVLRSAGTGALFGGVASGAGPAWSAAKRGGNALLGRFQTARATGDLGAITLPQSKPTLPQPPRYFGHSLDDLSADAGSPLGVASPPLDTV